jgi:type I restriction enzyme S subunit
MREDWQVEEIGKLFHTTSGGTPSRKNSSYYNGDIPWVKSGELDRGIIYNTEEKITEEAVKNSSAKLFPKKTLLIALYGATIGKLAFLGIEAATNQAICGIFENENIDSKYLYHYLFFRRPKLISQGTGGAQPNISQTILKKLKFPLAPLPIQRAIVTKIENLFTSLDKGIADLKKAQEQLKIYRQAVLKKAFEGELTKEWREKQTDLPSADELLEQIKLERKRHYELQVEEWKKEVKAWEENGKEGKKPSNPRTHKKLPELTNDELEVLPTPPNNWTWSKIDNLSGYNQNALKAGPFGSSLKKSFYTDTGYKIYGQEQVISGDYKFGNYYVSTAKYNELISCAVAPFDVLISLVGTVGKVLILPDDCEEGIINPRLVKISLNDFYLPVFFKYYFESEFLKGLYKVKNHGTTMDVLNLNSIKELPFPLCTINEQNQIVKEIESRLSVCDKVEQNITEALDKSEALRQSILKKAFEGKLLSSGEIEKCKQEADYEPASELLKKIKAEKKK